MFDKSARNNGTSARADFTYDARRDTYTCPAGKLLTRYQRRHGCRTDEPHADGFGCYRARKADHDLCALKPRCCPGADARKVPRSVHEGVRILARADAIVISHSEMIAAADLSFHSISKLFQEALHGPV